MRISAAAAYNEAGVMRDKPEPRKRGIGFLMRLVTRRRVEAHDYSHAAVPNPSWLNEIRGEKLDNYIADSPSKKVR